MIIEKKKMIHNNLLISISMYKAIKFLIIKKVFMIKMSTLMMNKNTNIRLETQKIRNF